MIPSGVRIWAAAAPVDMRCGFIGLAEAAREQLAQEPGSGALFVFTDMVGPVKMDTCIRLGPVKAAGELKQEATADQTDIRGLDTA